MQCKFEYWDIHCDVLFSVLWKSLNLKDELKHWNLQRVKGSERCNVKPCFLGWKAGGVGALEVGATIFKSGKQSNCSALKIAKDDMDF